MSAENNTAKPNAFQRATLVMPKVTVELPVFFAERLISFIERADATGVPIEIEQTRELIQERVSEWHRAHP